MSLDERAGFINAPSIAGVKTPDGSIAEDSTDITDITDLHRRFGMLSSPALPQATAAYINNLNKLCEASSLAIPFVVSSNPVHGTNNNATSNISQWPFAIGLGAVNDVEVTKDFASIAKAEFKALGIRCLFGPVADLATEPRWQRINETMGSDSETIAEHIVELIKGFQGGDSLQPGGIICTVKHFPGHGAQVKGYDSHYALGQYVVNPGDNFDEHVYPFQKAFAEANAAGSMPCYSIYKDQDFEQVAAGFNEEILTTLGRDELGFEGFYTSDWGLFGIYNSGYGMIIPGSYASWGVEDLSPEAKIGKAIKAGMDQLGGHGTLDDIKGAITEGFMTEDDLDRACSNILRSYFTIGMFENPYTDVEAAASICNSDENKAAGLDAMHKSMVLLKNSSALPASASSKIYYEGNSSGTDSVFADFIEGGYEAEVVTDITQADIAVIRINGPSYSIFYPTEPAFMGYVGPSSRSLQYIDEAPDTEYGITPADYTDPLGVLYEDVEIAGNIGQLEKVLSARKAIDDASAVTKLVVIVNADRPVVVKEYVDKVDALLLSFGATDEAVLDMIFAYEGLKPSGKLPFELPSSDTEVEAQLEDVADDTLNPAFEAGFGLTYQ